MSRSRTMVCLLVAVVCLSILGFTSQGYAATPDRILGELNSGQKVQLTGNIHGYAKPESDLGRADGSRVIEGISLNFKLSPAQQKDLNQFLVQLGDHSSPNFHKYLTIPQFAKRFGMSENDVDKVVGWIQSQGFTNIKVAPTHNKVSFDGTVAQIESLFALEMHNYLVNGEVHTANSSNPSLPGNLSGIVGYVGHLNDFAPKPRAKVRPNFTSYVSGNHFLTPGDFATIYDVNALYSAGVTGLGQKIVIVGQTTVSPTDLSNFRSAAGLAANPATLTLMEGTATRCSGDEGESDLDLEWSGGVAKDAQITFLYAGLGAGDSCTNRFDSVWDALEDALTGTTTGASGHPIAPFVSTSYGFCESGLGAAFAGGPLQNGGQPGTLEQWIQTGQALGVTLASASGDAGAADCDPSNSLSATKGLAVDAPAAIPETTGAGGNEFTGDAAGTVSGNQAGADNPYWSGSGAGSDGISTALEYIPEEAWNDTTLNLANGGGLGASGGGVSIYFTTVPTFQQGVAGVPSPGTGRYVPDISLTASADHDGYLFCSEDASVTSCASGFRESAGGNLTVVGGTSAVAPTFTAIMALINQYLGNTPPTGLAPINPTLYQLYPSNGTSGAFNDIKTGSNIVPCTSGTPNCPTSGTLQYGFNAGTGYDEVTGLGSVNGFALAQAWAGTLVSFNISATTPNPTSVSAGTNATTTVTITPTKGTAGTITITCSGLPTGASCSAASVSGGSGTADVTISTSPTTPTGTSTVTIKGAAGGVNATTTVSLTVTATTESFTLASSLTGAQPTLSVQQGQTSAAVTFTVQSSSTPSFIVSSGSTTMTAAPVTYSCSGLPTESTCTFTAAASGSGQQIVSSATSVSLTIQTTAPTTKLAFPLDRGTGIYYAMLLPGVMGIVFTIGSRKRMGGTMRVLTLIAFLGISTIWLASCGGSSNNGGGGGSNPGTPVGSSTVTINATTGGSGPSTSLQFTLAVSAAAR